MDIVCNVLNSIFVDFFQFYVVMVMVEDWLFGCFGFLFLEFSLVSLEFIQENVYDWFGIVYNFDGFGFMNIGNFYFYFKLNDGNLVFVNRIFEFNSVDSIYQFIEIRMFDFELICWVVVYGLVIEGLGLEDGDLCLVY